MLINFLIFDYLIINIIVFCIVYFLEKNYLFFDFKINIYLFYLFFNSSLTLILISLISKKNIGINKTIIFENLLKNLLFVFIILFLMLLNIKSINISKILYGFTISCYFLSFLLFIINFKFLKKILIHNYFNKKIFFKFKIFFKSRLSKSIISTLIVIETNLPVIIFTYYKLNILLADYYILLTLLMFFNFINTNISLNVFEKFLNLKKNIEKTQILVTDYFIITLPFIIGFTFFLLFFWDLTNLYIFDSKFNFDKILILMLIILYLCDYLFGNNHIFYLSKRKDIKNYILLCSCLNLLSSSIFIYFLEYLSLKFTLSILILNVLIRNLFLHFSITSTYLDISIFNYSILSSIRKRVANYFKKIYE